MEEDFVLVCRICGKKAVHNEVIGLDYCLEHGFELVRIPASTGPEKGQVTGDLQILSH